MVSRTMVGATVTAIGVGVALNVAFGLLPLAEGYLALVIFASAVHVLWAYRTGRTPKGTGLMVPVGLAMWGFGHVTEAIVVSRHAEPLVIGPSDFAFFAATAILLLASAPVLMRSATYHDHTALLRTLTDSAMIAIAIAAVYWQWVVQRVDPGGGDVVAHGLPTAYVGLCSMFTAAMVTRAWQRRDAGSWLLAAGALVAVTGVGIWSTAKFGADHRLLAATLMTSGVAVVPLAATHPANARALTVRRGDERDALGALAFLTLAITVTLVGMVNTQLSRVHVGFAALAALIAFARVAVVRQSERRLVSTLRDMAFTDPLTGLGNRRLLTQELDRPSQAFVLTLDLDGFKQVNDSLGHDAGDAALQTIATRLRALAEQIRADGWSATLFRIGGDEFAAVLRCPPQVAEAFAKQAVRHALNHRYPWITASVGMAVHTVGTPATDSVRNADIALQEAKRAGKGRVVLLDADLLETHRRELLITARLRTGMDQLRLAFQPICRLGTGDAVAVEALARWTDPELGEVSPAEFVPVCERHGLVGKLGSTVLRLALAQMRAWRDAGEHRQVSINVSWLQLREESAVEEMSALLSADPHLARSVILEVTESVFDDDAAALDAVRRLRELGVAIAIDDFGSGASTLTRLRWLPADVLKLDKSLLDDATSDPSAAAVLRTVGDLGRAMGMAVIAEGVEDEPTAALLDALEFDFVQGFHFYRPMPAAELPPAAREVVPRRAGVPVPHQPRW